MSQLSIPSFDSPLMLRDSRGRYRQASADQILKPRAGHRPEDAAR